MYMLVLGVFTNLPKLFGIQQALVQNNSSRTLRPHKQYDAIGPGGLRAPPEVAFAMRSWPLLLPTFGLSFYRLSFSISFAFDPLGGNSQG